ncbi:conserved protein of unknown function [Tenacibaculum sp. 190130A14a]|uniref:Uncharacterized protein n=1 Tax=Tenacibaculum polynesiense TaxID=3137857 RepID=A0ABM9P9R3_9FLAO
MKKSKEELKQFFETGDKPSQEQYADLIDSYIDAKQPQGEANRRFVIDETGEVSVTSEQKSPSYQAGTNISIDNADPNNPVINATVGETVDTSNLVPFTGGVKQLDLANDIKLGSLLTKVGKARHNVYLKDKATGNNIVKHQNEYWDGSKWLPTSGMMIGFNTGINNTGVNASGYGTNSLKDNTGINSSGFGNGALQNNVGANSSGFGVSALFNNTGVNASGFGLNALSSNTGHYVNAVGINTMLLNTGDNSNAFGSGALSNNLGDRSNGFGNYALQFNTQYDCNGFGYHALNKNSGINSNGIGTNALRYNSGNDSNGIGNSALINNLGARSIGIGSYALRYNEGGDNIAIGYSSFGSFYPDISKAKTILSSEVDINNNRVTMLNHGFGNNGSLVNLRYSTTGTAIGGLNINGIFVFKIIDSNTLEASSNLINEGSGQHTFTPQYTFVNTTTIGNNSQPTKSNQIVLGNTSLNEVTTSGDYVSTGIGGKGLILTTPDGTKQYRISVDNSGSIITTLI